MSKKQDILVLVFSSALFSVGGVVHGQMCDVADDGSGCVQTACSPIPEDQCLPAAIGIDWTTGAISVAECQCRDMNACHIEFGNATPFAVGYCPPDTDCDVESIDLNNDGLPDLFHAVCRPDGVSVCCLDIDDGPVPLDTCMDLGEESCAAEGGQHYVHRVGCSGTEACCLGEFNQPLCADLHPTCCTMSGGVPLGPETTCTTANGVEACGQICGGFAGIPCDDARAFCRLPDGGCCCDFMGVCTLPPEVCPDVLEPVCGCDEHTYRNECEAFAAGMSIAHRGPCGPSACCLPNGECLELTLDVCVAEGGEPILNAGCETVTCSPAPTGACCVSDAAGLAFCQIRTHDECGAINGTYLGDGTECPTDPNTICGVFACCLPDGLCANLPIESCLVEGGEPLPNAECTSITCAPQATGACCLPNIAGLPSCIHRTEEDCAGLGGAYQGDGSSCPSDPSVPCGDIPCCLPNNECVEVNAEVCLAEGGRPVANAGGCALVNCIEEPVGACCINDPATNLNCFVRTRADCESVGGAYQGDGSTCPSDPTLACGGAACCLPNGACVVLAIEHCLAEGGDPIPGVPGCETVFCTPPAEGACCLSTAAGTLGCIVTSREHCAAEGGAYQGDNTTCPSDPNVPCGDPCDGLCTDAASCFAGCGTLIQGFECVWFQSESGDVFVLDDLGGFDVGDHVFVKGCRSTDCIPTLCTPADPCLTVHTIRSCQQTCGGIAGIPCEDPSQFCKFPDGTCGDGDVFGVCVSVGGGICPAVWIPVCGCDGNTYGNECEATSAGVSIAHDGECSAMCGGIAGIPCEDPGQFCRFPEGTCGGGDIPGVCVPRPNGCPDVWDPVCGCDGATYSNECDAAAAGVSIAHRGECARVCGGLGPAPPCEPNEFCRFPVGSCGDSMTLGVCVPIPDACPEIFDPVCGCDGTTYDNACEAIRAMVSIAHPGECTECTAIRVFSDPPFSYCPSDAKGVRIVLNAPATATAIAVDDQPPAGWVVGEIGQGGVFDPVNGKVKWGPLFPPFPPGLTYVVTPVDTNTAGSCFGGTVSIDGFNRPICGAECLERLCCPRLSADRPQEACGQCPAGGCESCDDACGNGRVTMCELIGYACAWRHGCNDDLAGMTRAAFIWRNGECYCWDDINHTWLPTDCDPAGASCCGAGSTGSVNAAEDPSAGVTVRIRRATGNRLSRASEAVLEAAINPPQGTMASGLELDIPPDWKTVRVSNGGEWDAVHGKVKWGPLFGDGRTVVSVTIRQATQPVSRKARAGGRVQEVGRTVSPLLGKLGGTVAFDGVMRPVSFE